ncbi:MAG: hypothetical protein JNN06_09545 [Gemmobacter sp.]|uniref:hypothetical protein n=1 Tax=Gemmobacter sp. TaxID=1898957 RepID=UPI001A4A9A84|nr:hypothetical protein [Gemmobacter sp.]MBL8562513.1 hypothetical protein [Gemmobacter sp.]
MILLLPLLAIGVFLYLWLSRRGSTLTRHCLWRLHRAEGVWRCAACGAESAGGPTAPRHCLRPPPPDAGGRPRG